MAVALALGAIAGPASGRTFDFDSNGSLAQQRAPSTAPAADPASSENSIDWGYVATVRDRWNDRWRREVIR